MPAARPRIDLKATHVSALQMALRTRDGAELAEQLRQAWGDVGAAFAGEALCLDLSELPPGPPLDVPGLLADNDAWSCFNRLGDLLVTGPTRTNVNDFRAVLIG